MAGLAVALQVQAEACARLGSPMYAELLQRMAGDLGTPGPLERVLAGHEDDPGPSALFLRLLGTVHRLVLERRAGALAAYYPSVGGRWDCDAAWPAFVDLLDVERGEVRRGLERPPQTNEVGRSAALVGALLRLPAAALPVRLIELGASGGLNLRADRFRYTSAEASWGPPDSPVVLDDAWLGAPTPVERSLNVVERIGCDTAPVDPATTEGRTLLTAYVWPDQQSRLHRLRGAFEVAAATPAHVRRERALDLVARLEPQDGACTVLWHSIVWQYLDAAEQAAVRGHVERLAGAASAEAPFVHLALEPTRRTAGGEHEFLVVVEQWPHAPEPAVLGTAAGHGPPVSWEA